MKEHIKLFLEQYGKADHPDMPESVVALLMDDHFYYIDDDLSGYFIKNDISGLMYKEIVIHDHLKSKKE